MIPKSGYRFFGKRSCSKKKLERDDDSKKSHHALAEIDAGRTALAWKSYSTAKAARPAIANSTIEAAMKIAKRSMMIFAIAWMRL